MCSGSTLASRPSQNATYEDNPYADHLKQFAAYYYNRSSDWSGGLGVINYKLMRSRKPRPCWTKNAPRWRKFASRSGKPTPRSAASSWGYTQNQRYKTPDRLVDDLVDIVSKNGCLLLNVGPRADGTIPEEDQAILKAIGGWLEINGEAIYDTTYWKTFGEGPTSVSTGHVSESKDKPFTAADLRFTTRGDMSVRHRTGMAGGQPNHGQDAGQRQRRSQDIPTRLLDLTMLGSDSKLQLDA